MDDSFLDTSWSLYHHPINNVQTYRKIFTSSASTVLETYSDRLTTLIANQAAEPKDDFDTENEKLGAFRECRWKSIRRPSLQPSSSSSTTTTTNTKRSIYIEIIYQKQTYKAILFSPFLILVKASASCTRQIFDFLGDTFGISLDALKVSPDFVQGLAAGYITTLSQSANTTTSSTSDDNNNNNLTRLSIFKTAVSNVKLTISFIGPVAPNLKTVDLDIPYDTVDSLISQSPTQSQSPTRTDSSISLDESGSSEKNKGTIFLSRLAHYLAEQTGLKLPLATQSSLSSTTTIQSTDSESSSAASPARLSRVSTAFWVFSVEGKIKFSGRVVDGATGYEDAIRAAGSEILVEIDAEARRRNAASGTD